MANQPRLTDFDESLFSGRKQVYSQHVVVLQRLSRLEPLSEIKALMGLSSQAIHQHLLRLARKRWVERTDFGVWEVTREGLNYLTEINGRNKLFQSDGRLPVNRSKVFDWLSVHYFKVRFNLKGERFDKRGLEKNFKNRWVEYSDAPPTTLECRKRCLTVTVHGLRGSSALELARKGLEAARERVLSFCSRRGARVFECGEFMGMPHWVIEELNTSRELAGLLGLRSGAPSVRVAGLVWYLDKSHEGLVEARGELETAKRVFGEFEYLLTGGLRQDLGVVKSELASVKDVAREVAGLREDLRFKPSGLARRDTA